MNTQHESVYLIGTREAFIRTMREKGLSLDDPHVTHVDKLEILKHVHSGHVTFLKGWEVLEEGRALYNHVIGARTARRLDDEEREYRAALAKR